MSADRLRRMAFAFNAAFALINAALVVAFAVDGRVAWINCVGAAVNTFLAIRNRPNKENSHGRHREAEAGTHDPGTGSDSTEGTAVYATGGTIGTGTSLTYSIDPAYYATPTALGTAIRRAMEQATPEVEQVQSDMPILAHRIARLRLDGKGTPFVPLNHGKPFARDAVARCEDDLYGLMRASLMYGRTSSSPKTPHVAPSLGCTCGFYSLPSDIEPWDTGCGYVTLQVELSGTVIEHDRGYRASHQYVLQARLEPCPYCASPSEVALFNNGDLVGSACRSHAQGEYVAVDFADLSRVLGVPVVSAAPLDGDEK